MDVSKPALQTDEPISLTVCNVTFGYQSDQPILQNVNIEIGSHAPTVIIGDSGCGKSTLAKLMSGLYVPNKGYVAANGFDIAAHDPHSVRRAIAYLPQEPILFSGSILENLLLAKPDATDEEIRRALADSAGDRVIAQLPDGIHTEVGERGSHLSGGQRQRIALARALLINPGVLILDEPTSSLDAQTTARVAETLQRLARERTLIVITHKPDLLGEGVNVINLSAFRPIVAHPATVAA